MTTTNEEELTGMAAKDTLTKPHVAVLMGGLSAEREISLVTGGQVAEALTALGCSVTRIDAGHDLPQQLATHRPDVAFIALHGKWGEDGTVQSLLELMGIPYTGSGVLASAVAMDKAMAKVIFKDAGLPVARSVAIRTGQWSLDSDQVISVIAEQVGFPCVVKPISEGSALGVVVAQQLSELPGAIIKAFEYDESILAEEYLPGTELTVGVIGLDELRIFPSVEIVPNAEFYDFESKYSPGASDHIIPARLPEGLEAVVGQCAVTAHKAIGCRDFSRTDFKLDADGVPRILEINTIPGMTPTSLFPEAALAAGMSFNELIDTMISFAMKRA